MSKLKPAEPIERDEAQIPDEIEAQRSALSEAQREIGELQRRRRKMLLAAGVEAIQEIDSTHARAATKVDIAQAKIDALGAEFEGLRTAKCDAQIAADLARAHGLADEAHHLIVGDYVTAARSIAQTLARLAAIETEVRTLNARLPPGAYVEIEAFKGYRATFAYRVRLPGTASEDAAFWPTRPRCLTINELYARS